MVEISPKDMEAFGLTTYESKAYLKLLENGKEYVRPLAQKSGVPMGRIYDILHSLEFKGLITSDKARPVSYIAREPKVAIESLIANKERDLDDLRSQASDFERRLESLKDAQNRVIRDVAFNEDIIQQFVSKIGETKTILRIYYRVDTAKEYAVEEIQYFRTMLKKLVVDGVTITYILGGIGFQEISGNLSEYIPALDGIHEIKVGVYDTSMQSFDVIDDTQVLLKVSDPIDPRSMFSLIYIQDAEFATRLIDKFDRMWEECEKII